MSLGSPLLSSLKTDYCSRSPGVGFVFVSISCTLPNTSKAEFKKELSLDSLFLGRINLLEHCLLYVLIPCITVIVIDIVLKKIELNEDKNYV